MEALASLLASKLDPRAKFKLLDMLDERPVTLIDAIEPETNGWSPDAMDRLLKDEVDYLVIDSLFQGQQEDMLLACRAEAEEACSFMKEAGFGRD